MERYEGLVKVLIKQGICKEKTISHYKDERTIIMNFCDDVGVINSFWGKEKNFNRNTFCHWVINNNLNEEVVIKEANMELMSDEALKDIVEYLKKRNANIPENEEYIYKIDSNNWIHMQEELEAELVTRRMFCVAQSKGKNIKELKNLLKGLLDFELLHTQKDCLYMYHQVMGIERCLISVSEDVNMQKLLKSLEKGKNVIIEKRWEFFEKEEGHKYEKIGDGVYQSKEN